MPGKVLIIVSILVLCLGFASCAKREHPPVPEGSLRTTSSPYLDAIPRDYGRFVGVTIRGEKWNALWFEKEDGTIVVVSVNLADRNMYTTAVVIPRK
jgi:hypothetical protein